jgi:hypothetical protein
MMGAVHGLNGKAHRERVLSSLELEPFIGIFDDGFVEAENSIAKPGQKVYKVCAMGTYAFNILAKEDGKGYEDMEYWPVRIGDDMLARDWWIGGMQKWVVNEVIFISDGDDFIYVFYAAQNHAGYTKTLGRLRPGSEIESIIKEAFDVICI